MANQTDRTKLLVLLRRISCVFENAIRNGPDGTLEGKFKDEHPLFIHYACSFYLSGVLAYLEGEDGERSWNEPSSCHKDFDTYAASNPINKSSFLSRGYSCENLDALAELRNAIVHNDGDLTSKRKPDRPAIVSAANFPGVKISGTKVTLEKQFLEYVRVAGIAVRRYYGEE